MNRPLYMKRFENILILVAVDGSDSSKNALRQAVRFAKREGCNITVVTALPSYEGEIEIGLLPSIRETLSEPGKKILAEAQKVAKEEGAEIATVMGEGNTHEVIIDVAQEKGCDLIIVGRTGAGGIDRAFMGSVAARVIGYSPVDVLIIPDGCALKWDNILLAIDGSQCSEVATNAAISMARLYGQELYILSVVDVNEEFYANAPDAVDKMVLNAREMVQGVEQVARFLNIPTMDIVREGEAHDRIVGMAQELKADVICVGSHGRTGIRRLLMGSVTEKVIGRASCPVLVAKGC